MEIAFEPYKKVSFRSYLQFESAEEFISMIAMGTPAGVLSRTNVLWANGVIFRHFTPAPSDIVSKELINGHLVFDHVEFAPMPTYRREFQGPQDRPLVTINVIDVSRHIVFDPFTKWIWDNLINLR